MPRLLFVWLIVVAALGTVGCRARTPPPGGAQGSKPDQARKQAESLATNVVAGAAEAQARANPSLARRGGGGFVGQAVALGTSVAVSKTGTNVSPPRPAPGPDPATPAASQAGVNEAPPTKSLPRPGPPPVIQERVASTLPYLNEAEAEEDAVNAACDLIQRRLAELDPPVRYRPTANEAKNEFLRRDSRATRQPNKAEQEFYNNSGSPGIRTYVEFDVEVTADQVRELRTRDRVGQAFRVLGGLTAVALAAFLFLRLDEWTKGYLTRWLAVAAVLLAGGAAAALYFV